MMVVMMNMIHVMFFLVVLLKVVVGADFPWNFDLHRVAFFMILWHALLMWNFMTLLEWLSVVLVLGYLVTPSVLGMVAPRFLFVVPWSVLSRPLMKVDFFCGHIVIVIGFNMRRMVYWVGVMVDLGDRFVTRLILAFFALLDVGGRNLFLILLVTLLSFVAVTLLLLDLVALLAVSDVILGVALFVT